MANIQALGELINWVDVRNKGVISDNLLGINIDKFFMPSVANIIGTDLSSYKLIRNKQFACNPMHVGRDEKCLLLCIWMIRRRLCLPLTLYLKLKTPQKLTRNT